MKESEATRRSTSGTEEEREASNDNTWITFIVENGMRIEMETQEWYTQIVDIIMYRK